MICGLSRAEVQSLILSVGTHRGRRRLSPMEVAALLRKAIEAGTSRKTLSNTLKISEIQISRFVRLFDLKPELQDLADWGRGNAATLSFSSLLEIAGLGSCQQIEVATKALEHNLTKMEFRQISQLARRSGGDITACIADILRRRPQVHIQFALMGSVQQDDLRDHLGTQLQNARDQLLGEVLDTLFGQGQGVQGRLGSKTFTILADQDITDLLDMDPDAIESLINQHLNLLVQSK